MIKNFNKFSKLNGKVILITGATGSFGNCLIKKIINSNSKFKKLIIFSRDELKQYELRQSILNHPKFKNLRFFLGDVRDADRIETALQGVDYVIHAAAQKQVEASEYNPEEVIKTNIIGSMNLIRSCNTNKIKKLIALSTDKAVNPVNIYGATKMVAERLFTNSNSNQNFTRFSVVRYGNVYSSRGSVIPTFKKIIKDGNKFLPITSINMTRFWISLDESVNFVLNALVDSKGGEIYVPKLNSVKIIDMANALDSKITKKIVGIRNGEKIDEILYSDYEAKSILEFDKHFLIFRTKHHMKKYIKENKLKKFNIIKDVSSYSSGSNNFLSIKDLKKYI